MTGFESFVTFMFMNYYDLLLLIRRQNKQYLKKLGHLENFFLHFSSAIKANFNKELIAVKILKLMIVKISNRTN